MLGNSSARLPERVGLALSFWYKICYNTLSTKVHIKIGGIHMSSAIQKS